MNDEKKGLVPRLRFPEFREEGEWKKRKLGTQGDFLSSLTGKSAKDFDIGDARFIPYMNVFSNTFTDVRDLRTVDVAEGESQNAVVKGDVFFTVSSETPEEAGMSSVLLEEINKCYLNSFCAMFRFDINRSPNPEFLGYWLRSGLVRAHLSRGAQGATRYNISKPVFREVPLLLPAPREQQKIADCLSSLDALIAAQADKLDALMAHKKGLMGQLFPREGQTIPRLRFPEFREAGKWEERRLEDLAKRGSGHTPSKKISSYYNGGIKWVSLADSNRLDAGYIYDTKIEISEDGINNSSAVLHPAGTVILSRDAGVGKSAVLFSPMAVSQHFMAWQCHKSELSNWFLYYLLQKKKSSFEMIAVGNTIKTIGVSYFKEMAISVPSLSEQQKIANCLSSLDSLIAAQTEKIDALRIHKKGLMQQLLPNPEVVGA
ncbi:MAG: restriction endonuclease subunit S [Candidatus Thiodiazotropha endolucinida]